MSWRNCRLPGPQNNHMNDDSRALVQSHQYEINDYSAPEAAYFSAEILAGTPSGTLALLNASFDDTVVFFLLHEQPEDVRRKTIAEAIRVTKPGGRIIFVD